MRDFKLAQPENITQAAELLAASPDTTALLAGGTDLPTTVMPFILRGVRLQGIDSVMAPIEVRERAWARLANDLPAGLLDEITEIVPMSQLADKGPEILAGQVRGRLVVDPNA